MKKKILKWSMRKDKRDWLYRLVCDAETAVWQYDITKIICNGVKDGQLLIKEEVGARWKEHFSEVFNRPEPSGSADVDNSDTTQPGIDGNPQIIIKIVINEKVRTVLLRELKN